MSNRTYTQFQWGLEKKAVSIYCNATGTGASAPTLNSWTGSALATAPSAGYKGVKSITRNGVGDYTFTFQDTYNRLLDLSLNVLAIDGATTPLVAACWIKSVNATATGGATVRLVFYLSAPGTPADAGTNERLYLVFTWSDSNAQ